MIEVRQGWKSDVELLLKQLLDGCFPLKVLLCKICVAIFSKIDRWNYLLSDAMINVVARNVLIWTINFFIFLIK